MIVVNFMMLVSWRSGPEIAAKNNESDSISRSDIKAK